MDVVSGVYHRVDASRPMRPEKKSGAGPGLPLPRWRHLLCQFVYGVLNSLARAADTHP